MKREQPDYPEVEVHLEAPHRVRPFPHVYALPTVHPDWGYEPSYCFTLPFEALRLSGEEGAYTASVLTTVRQANDWADEATVTARTRIRPEVVPMCRHPEGGLYPDLSRVDDLVVELRNLTARNLSPDVVFKERDVLLTVRAYDYDFTRRGGRTGTSLTLLKVGVLL
jgi:hypothetical protein